MTLVSEFDRWNGNVSVSADYLKPIRDYEKKELALR